MPQGFIYVLHFADKLSHAQHYTGSTFNLMRRLTAHANGGGARLTQVIIDKGIEWQVGALGVFTGAGLRRIERKTKNQHNAARFCHICNPSTAAKIEGTKDYPLASVPFPLSSRGLKDSPLALSGEKVVELSTQQPAAGGKVLLAKVQMLMTEEREALGFIPAGGDAGINVLYEQSKIALAFFGGTLVGYCLFTVDRYGLSVNIMQIVVRDDARGFGFGEWLLNRVYNTGAYQMATAKVRVDLTANEFWHRMGFDLKETVSHKSSGSRLNHYVRYLTPGVDSSNGAELQSEDFDGYAEVM